MRLARHCGWYWAAPVAVIYIYSSTSICAAATFTGIGDIPGGEFSSGATDVSADGMIVVGGGSAISGNVAIYWTRQTGLVALPRVPFNTNASVSAFAISADGSTIVGRAAANGDHGGFEAFMWTAAGGTISLGDLPGGIYGSAATEVSADGSTIVGFANDSTGRVTMIWTKEHGMQRLGGPASDLHFSSDSASAVSANGSVVVGNTGASNKSIEAFRWTAVEGLTELGHLPGSELGQNRVSFAADVSTDGSTIVGTSRTSPLLAFQGEAYRWTSATGMVGLGYLPGGLTFSRANATSADGSVVVGESWTDAGEEAFRWTEALGMQSLRELLIASGIDMTGWKLRGAAATSADGTVIVGYGTNPAGHSEGWIADLRTVPEPSSVTHVAWLCCGVLTFYAARRRRGRA